MLTILAGLLLLQPAIERDVVYSRPGGAPLTMDVYLPRPAPARPAPGVVVLHGGAWVIGRRQDMDSLARRLAANGMVAATVTYRLAPEHTWPAMLDDAQTAVRFLRTEAARFGIDPSRIGAAGASAGGHLALLLGFRDTRDPRPAEHTGASSRVQAVLNLYGPTDLSRDFGRAFNPLFVIVARQRRQDAAKLIRDASPVNFVSGQSAPVFTFHGAADRIVPVAQAKRLTDALKAAGVEHETVIVEGVGHGVPLDNPEVAEAMDRGIEFLRRRLGPPSGRRLLRASEKAVDRHTGKPGKPRQAGATPRPAGNRSGTFAPIMNGTREPRDCLKAGQPRRQTTLCAFCARTRTDSTRTLRQSNHADESVRATLGRRF
jgi:acetyl esterase/lipase